MPLCYIRNKNKADFLSKCCSKYFSCLHFDYRETTGRENLHGFSWLRYFGSILKLSFYLGKYMYIETSSPRQSGDNAKLVFKRSVSGMLCLKFFYHMYGSTMGTLNVYSGSKKIFTKSGDQGNKWEKVERSITSSVEVI